MIKQSVITDEISQDVRQAACLAKQYGLSAIEIRSAWNKPVHELDVADLQEIRSICQEYGLTVCALSSAFYKCALCDDEIPGQLALLEKLISTARTLGCSIIRGFSFWRDENSPAPEALARYYVQPARMLQEAGMYLVLESDPSVTACNGEMLARLVKAVDHPAVRVLWDPGNDLYSPLPEQPYPHGYSFVRPYVHHVHIKDAVCTGNAAETVRIGDGTVNWPGQLRALVQDGYEGYASLETHYRIGASISEAQMKQPSGNDFSAGGYAASEACLQVMAGLFEQLEHS